MELPGGARFCLQCGQAVAAGTVAPVRSPAPAGYTPKHLAERILTSKAALEGERKQVTVLFADLKGSMELLADRDPEEARKLLDPVLERMMEAVHHYEGTVNQVMGDGIMALFGAPLAHEDPAVRACYAALRMQEFVKQYAEEVHRTMGVPLHIRVGLNSGEVVVRSIGSDLHMDYTAVGQTTHLAARFEHMAMPGSILIAPETLNLAEGYILVKPLGERPVKGLDVPVEVFEVIGASTVRSRLQAAAGRGLTRFVGRDAEIEQLRQAAERSRGGHGQVVAVVGEPGVGKSRLFWEFTHSHRLEGWLIVESISVSYGKATAFLPLIDLLRAYFQIEARDEARTIREKVTGKLLSLDRTLEPFLPALLWLLDVPVDDPRWERLAPPQRRQQALDGIKRLLLRESQAQPLLLLFEDLHWIDAETQALLDTVVESLPTTRVLLLVNYRPEYQHTWGGKTYYRQLRIDPLPAESADDLLTTVLGTDPSLDSLKRTLIERTEGNPLFLEESVRTLVETKALVGSRHAYRLANKVTGVEVPVTVQAILAARIDRLAPGHKRLLQAASAIGKDVPFTLLRAIAEMDEEELRQGLAHLQAAEFLYETSLFPDLEHTFKHALTHEVTYGGLLLERRRHLHARILDASETLYRDRLEEHVERLAHHAVRGEVWGKAVSYLRQAGHKAIARSSPRDARGWFEQALAVLTALPETPSTLEQGFETRIELRPVLNMLGDFPQGLERLREAEALAERLNDDGRRARVWAFMALTHTLLSELDEALAAGHRAFQAAERLGDLKLRLLATTYLVQAHHNRGEYEAMIELATKNVAALPPDWRYERFGNSMPLSIYDRGYLVRALVEVGRFEEATQYAAEALRLAEPTHQMWPIGWAHYHVCWPFLYKGDWARAHGPLEDAIAAYRRGHIALTFPDAVAMSAWVLTMLGRADEGAARYLEGVQLLEHAEATGLNLAMGYRYLGRTALQFGRLDDARRMARQAFQASGGPHQLHLLGDVAAQPDQFDPEGSEDHYRRALELADRRRMRPLTAHCHLGLGKLYRRTGKREQAQEHFTTAATMYREMRMTYWLEQAEADLRLV